MIIPKLLRFAVGLMPLMFVMTPDCIHGQLAGDYGLSPEVRNQIEKRVALMADVSIKYRVFYPENRYSGDVNYLTYFEGSCFFQSIVATYAGESKEEISEYAFDGKIFYYGQPKIEGKFPALLTKYLAGDLTDPQINIKLVEFPYLDATGFYVPERLADMKAPLTQSLLLYYLNQSTSNRIEQVGENLLVRLEIPDPVLTAAREIDIEKEAEMMAGSKNATKESIAQWKEATKTMRSMIPKRVIIFLLDPKRGYADVKREEQTLSGQRIFSVEYDQWEHYATPGIWLPKRCILNTFANWSLTEFSSTAINTTTVKLDDLKFGALQDFNFVLDYKKPGTLILDRTTPEAQKKKSHQVSYALAANGDQLRVSAERVSSQINKSQRLFFEILFAILFVLPPVIWFIYHKKDIN